LPKAIVDVGEVIDRSRISSLQITVLVLGMAMALVDGYDTQAVAYALTSMAAEWGSKPADFAPAFTVGLFGLTLGAVVLGQLGDRFGRKPMLLLSVVLFGIFTLTIVWATNLRDLFWMRLVIGIGLGGMLPNVASIVADFAPERHRRTAVMIVIGCLAAGAFFGGIIAGHILPTFGWRAIFYAGGGASLLMFLVGLYILPESPAFLAARDGRDPRIAHILRRITPSLETTADTTFIVHRAPERRASVRQLFTAGRAPITALLWIAMVIQLVILYMLVLWLPTLAKESGNPVETALFASAIFSLGGLTGSLLLGPIAERIGPHVTLCGCYLLIAAASLVLASAGTNVPLLNVASFATGLVTFGGWSSLTALMANYYPPEIRSTGVGFGTGIGRAGSMLSPWLVGLFLAAGWHAHDILILPVVPAIVACACVALVGLLRRNASTAAPTVTSVIKQH
jgi:AAHS family 4-hydroxybenzoate transporter-like MFS transporter